MKYPMIDAKATGTNLKMLMKEKNLKAETVRKMLGMSDKSSLYKWFRGEAVPSIDNLVILGSIFGVKLDDLIKTSTVA